MRISSSTIYEASVGAMQQQSAKLLQVQQQISTGRRMLTPADDPIGAAQALQVTQSQTMNTQYGTNAGSASDSLTLEESVLGNITTLLQDVRDISVTAGNGALSSNDRAILATDLSGRYQQLLALANTVDGNGQYLFSGYQGGVRPFTAQANGTIDYNGDQGQRLIQISASEQLAVSDAGSDVFQRIAVAGGGYQDVFKTIDNLVQLLQTSPGGAGLTTGLATALGNIDNALNNVINVRTSVGSRLKSLDAAQSAGEDRALQYSQTLSRLQDVDYAKAAAELMQQQVGLQAAQQSFVKLAGLSLFNYL
ncbi:MAG: flagellar hook-associated protein 3 [Comamonadaceae bacterium]|nr:MAG: flagellar hook-associated protein 3 [Comamonadaceae bacterium]